MSLCLCVRASVRARARGSVRARGRMPACACDRTLKPTAAAQIVHAPVEEMLKLRLARTGVLRCVGLTLPTFAPAGTGAHPCRIRAATALNAASVWLCACVRACVHVRVHVRELGRAATRACCRAPRWAFRSARPAPPTSRRANKQTTQRSRYHGTPMAAWYPMAAWSAAGVLQSADAADAAQRRPHRRRPVRAPSRPAPPTSLRPVARKRDRPRGASAAAHVRAGTCPPRTPLPSGAQVHRLRAERERQRRRLRSAGLPRAAAHSRCAVTTRHATCDAGSDDPRGAPLARTRWDDAWRVNAPRATRPSPSAPRGVAAVAGRDQRRPGLAAAAARRHGWACAHATAQCSEQRGRGQAVQQHAACDATRRPRGTGRRRW